MRNIRLYLNHTLDVGSDIVITDDRVHYLVQVLRVKIGTLLTVFNGQGGEYRGELIALEKKRAVLRILAHEAVNRESAFAITLAIGISRGERMTYVIQKAVELGVAAIQPLFTTYCEVKLDEERAEKRQQHWHGIIIAAAEQSGRTRLPILHAPKTLNTWIDEHSKSSSTNLVLHPNAELTLRQLPPTTAPTTITTLIGPEGGLSDDEVALARAKSFTAISLGPRILRTETAAAAVIAILQSSIGDL